MLDYKRFDGDWNVDGLNHDLRVHIDNLRLNVEGTYDPYATDMDMQVMFTIEDDPELTTFQVDPLLMNVGIPVRCTGTTQAPSCKLDEAGVRKIAADMLAGRAGAEADEKIDEAIDEKVPEEYRDTARSLLDMLRQGSKQNQQQQPNQ
jgi:AsmA protein